MNVRSFLCLLLALPAALGAPVKFEEHTIATDLVGGYQVVPYDINHDGKIDLIAVASGMTELVWFENPGWQRHVIATNLPHMINCAAHDIDGDGIPEIIVAYEFSMDASRSAGVLALLEHQGDPRNPWKLTEIDRLPTSHRLRWADIDGSGKKVLIDAPLTDAHAEAPEYRGHVPLVYYRPGEWKRILISDAEQGVLHGIYVTGWDHGKRDGFLTAGFLGIHLYQLGKNGRWSRSEIARGDPAPWPQCGSSDVALGRLRRERFIAAIEPWHGNQVVVYRERKGAWNREVIDASILDGHTLLTADFNGTGSDSIVAGFRGKPYGVYLYDFDGKKWNRRVIDQGGVAAAACAAADLDGRGIPDLACIGSATHNLKWYRTVR
jgi:FG-GAP-like repeat